MKLDKTTSIKVNSTKQELAKAKGYNLQDILDKALDTVLGLDNDTYTVNGIKVELEESKEKLIELEKTKENEIAKVTREYDNKINDLNFRINLLTEKLNNADEIEIERRRRQLQEEEYKELRALYIKYYGDYQNNEDLNEEIAVHIDLYDLDQEELLNRLRQELLEWEKEKFKEI